MREAAGIPSAQIPQNRHADIMELGLLAETASVPPSLACTCRVDDVLPALPSGLRGQEG